MKLVLLLPPYQIKLYRNTLGPMGYAFYFCTLERGSLALCCILWCTYLPLCCLRSHCCFGYCSICSRCPCRHGGADGDCPSFVTDLERPIFGMHVRKVGSMYRLGHIKNRADMDDKALKWRWRANPRWWCRWGLPQFRLEEKTDLERPIFGLHAQNLGGMHRLGHIKNRTVSRPLGVLANYP